jgi:Holliday junction resolvase RusA-like endonuclease
MEIHLENKILDLMASHFACLAAARSILDTKKPDADNVLKGIKEWSNGIIWRDDAQVAHRTRKEMCRNTRGARGGGCCQWQCCLVVLD